MIKTRINVLLLFKCQLLRIRGQSMSPAPWGACLVFQSQGLGTQTIWDGLAISPGVGIEVQKLPFLPFLEALNHQNPCIKISCGHMGIL